MNRIPNLVTLLVLAGLMWPVSPARSQEPALTDPADGPAFLMEALSNPEARVRQNAVSRLSELGEKPFGALVAKLSSGTLLEAATAAVVLKEIAGEDSPLPVDVRNQLYEILEVRPAVAWRWNIMATLLATEPGFAGESLDEHIELWTWGVGHPSPFIKLPSLRALQKTGEAGRPAEEAVFALLHQPHRPLTSLMIDSQVVADQQIGIEQPIPDYDPLTVLETLAAIGAEPLRLLPPLMHLTFHQSQYVRLDAAAMLGKLDVSDPKSNASGRSAEVLGALALDVTGSVRVAAVRELGEIDGAVERRLAVLETLLLNDRNDVVRMQAARSLGKMGADAQPALKTLQNALRFARLDTQDAVTTIGEAIKAIEEAK